MIASYRKAAAIFVLAAAVCAAFPCVAGERVASAQSGAAYLGWERCSACHEKVTEAWRQSRHATAFNSLAKSGQEGLPGCQKCHVTGYGEPGGFIDFELTPEFAGIQCEECHGAGKNHAEAPDTVGLTTWKPPETKCRGCHTPGQDLAFSYEKKVKMVHPVTAE